MGHWPTCVPKWQAGRETPHDRSKRLGRVSVGLANPFQSPETRMLSEMSLAQDTDGSSKTWAQAGDLGRILLARLGSAEPTVCHMPNVFPARLYLLRVLLYPSLPSPQPLTSPLLPKPFHCCPWSGSVLTNSVFSTSSQNISPIFLSQNLVQLWRHCPPPFTRISTMLTTVASSHMPCPSLSLPNAHLPPFTEHPAIFWASSISHSASWALSSSNSALPTPPLQFHPFLHFLSYLVFRCLLLITCPAKPQSWMNPNALLHLLTPIPGCWTILNTHTAAHVQPRRILKPPGHPALPPR